MVSFTVACMEGLTGSTLTHGFGTSRTLFYHLEGGLYALKYANRFHLNDLLLNRSKDRSIRLGNRCTVHTILMKFLAQVTWKFREEDLEISYCFPHLGKFLGFLVLN